MHLSVIQIQVVCRKAVTKKEWKRKKRYLIDVQLSTDKKLSTTEDRQTLQNFDEKQYCQYWILRLVVFTRFLQNGISPVFTELIVFVWFIQYVVAITI